ncbi:hypothetical protein C8F01DRAFT_468599 [Mycena amicta]|nr:hypothetical protein C8F01DRAFT_468599 [Mycena amicta]
MSTTAALLSLPAMQSRLNQSFKHLPAAPAYQPAAPALQEPAPVYQASPDTPSLWFEHTFHDEYARSVVALGLSSNAADLIQALCAVLDRSPELRTNLRVANNKLDQIQLLFDHMDKHAEDKDLLPAFQSAFWYWGGVQFAMKYRPSGNEVNASVCEPPSSPPTGNLTGWFPETFKATHPRSVVVHAMMDGVGDVIQALAPALTDYTALRTNLHGAKTSADKVNILFQFIDSHPSNMEFLSAFQDAVWKRGGVCYMFNPSLAKQLRLGVRST